MDRISIAAYKRNDLSRKGLKKYRDDGYVSGVMYGCGTSENFIVQAFLLNNLVYTAKKKIIDFNLNGEKHECILQEIQFHPVSETILHVDFLKIDNKKKITVNVNIKTVGIPIGVKNGGILLQKKRDVKLHGFPNNIPSEFIIDISDIVDGNTFRIENLKKNDEFEYRDNARDPIFSIKKVAEEKK